MSYHMKYDMILVVIAGTARKTDQTNVAITDFPENRSRFPHNHRFSESNSNIKYIL